MARTSCGEAPAEAPFHHAEPAGCLIFKAVEAILRSSPESPLMVQHQAVDDVVAQAVGIGGIMSEHGKPSGPRIVPVQSAISAEPQVTGAILDD